MHETSRSVLCKCLHVLTSFVPDALAPGSKVQRLAHCQLGLVQIILVHVSCSVDCLELVKVLAVVRDVASQLQQCTTMITKVNRYSTKC